MATDDKTKTADLAQLNSLLRGEISAVETYEIALPKFEGHAPILSELQRIKGEHQTSVQKLKEHIQHLGGTPSGSSGPWGAFANLVAAGAKILGPETALASLKQGEDHGVKEYERGLDDKDISAEVRNLFSTQLLPPCRLHQSTLDRLIEHAKAAK